MEIYQENTRENKTGIDKAILRLSIPAILSNITVPLLGICDTAVSGHLGSPAYIGGVAVGAMMINVIFWLCGFLRMGTSGLTANAFGASDIRGIFLILRRAFIIVCTISLLVIIAQMPLADLLLKIVGASDDVTGYARLYFTICIYGVPAQLSILAVSGWFIGMQNTVVPMIIAIASNIFNILLSIWLTFGIHRGFKGVALGTLSANWLGLLLALIFLAIHLRKIKGEEKAYHLSTANPDNGTQISSGTQYKWSRFIKINGNLFFRSACIMGVSMAVTTIGARLGTITLSANAVIMQFFLFFSYFMDGFAFSGEALVGRWYGTGDMKMMHRVVRHLLCWGGAVALLFFLVYIISSGAITGFITDDIIVRQEVMKYRLWIILLPPVTVAAFIFDGIFIGMTRTGAMLTATMSGVIVFAVILSVYRNNLTNNILWAAFEIYLLIRGMMLWLRYRTASYSKRY